MRICVSSDSTCDLAPAWLQEHGVTLFPLYIVMGGKTYRDGVDIHPADIFAHVSAGGDLCSTAANNVDDYLEGFRKIRETCDALIHITISAEFSSCFQNAKIAAAELDNVYVVDSRNLSTGHGLVVCTAVGMAESGQYTPREIVDELNDLTPRVEASFILGQLEYMRKGGRCSTVAALGANLLKLKPCVEVRNGKMEVGKKYRGSFQKCMIEYVRDHLQGRSDLDLRRIFVTRTTAVSDEIQEAVRNAVVECASFEEILTTDAGCTISCHCGPDCQGILYIRKKDWES